jgi:aspartyl-tRNA(Asn)/glutamyl-tRNA(Gln) amidotransferase subunit A
VEDAALMLTVISRPDHRDWTALPYEPRDYRDGLDQDLRGVRVAFSSDLGYANVDAEIEEIVASAVKEFSNLGAEVEVAHPGFEDPRQAFQTLWWSGAANGLSNLTQDQMKLVEPDLAEIVEEGKKISLLDYIAADHQRAVLGEFMMEFHQDYDLLLTPSLAVSAFAAGTMSPRENDNSKWVTWSPFTYPFNMTKQPAASVPCGFTSDGLPVGLQIVGPLFADHLVLRASFAYQHAFPLMGRRPPL